MDTTDQLIGEHGQRLTGDESRLLRASLHLTRQHVAVLATALTGRAMTQEAVYSCERSPDGYPLEVGDLLHMVESAVERASDIQALGPALRRVRAPHTVFSALDLPAEGVRITEGQAEDIARASSSLFGSLWDAVMVRAALRMKDRGVVVHVETIA